MSKAEPQLLGVVMICVNASGRAIAHAADFDLFGPGGYTTQEAQQLRCKRALAYAVINAYANPVIGEAMESMDAERLLAHLCRQGHTVHTIPIGHSA